ncbi:hypothetical protein [Herbiconiux sp. UC225_62]|uniref:hypothetical protein n=1 Tax=Herbiconiux sp. UC225_62 TaxID=3350168 RepID=UPI0036D352F0
MAGVAVAAALVLSGCTTEPAPSPEPDKTVLRDLSEQLKALDGVVDAKLSTTGYTTDDEFSATITIDDLARTGEITTTAISSIRSSEAAPAAYELEIRRERENLPTDQATMRLDGDPEAGAEALGAVTAVWADLLGVDGVSIPKATITTAGLDAEYVVTYDPLVAGVRPSAVVPVFASILADNGLAAESSTLTPGLDAPPMFNLDGKQLYPQGTVVATVATPLVGPAGLNLASTHYRLKADHVVDVILFPAVAADGTLLPLDLTSETVAAARQQVEITRAERNGWTVDDVVVFTQDGTQIFGRP